MLLVDRQDRTGPVLRQAFVTRANRCVETIDHRVVEDGPFLVAGLAIRARRAQVCEGIEEIGGEPLLQQRQRSVEAPRFQRILHGLATHQRVR